MTDNDKHQHSMTNHDKWLGEKTSTRKKRQMQTFYDKQSHNDTYKWWMTDYDRCEEWQINISKTQTQRIALSTSSLLSYLTHTHENVCKHCNNTRIATPAVTRTHLLSSTMFLIMHFVVQSIGSQCLPSSALSKRHLTRSCKTIESAVRNISTGSSEAIAWVESQEREVYFEDAWSRLELALAEQRLLKDPHLSNDKELRHPGAQTPSLQLRHPNSSSGKEIRHPHLRNDKDFRNPDFSDVKWLRHPHSGSEEEHGHPHFSDEK